MTTQSPGDRRRPLRRIAAERLRSGSRRFGDHDMGWTFAAVWLIFLAYPVVALVGADISTVARIYGLVLVAAFCGIYVAACIRVMPFGGDPDTSRRTAVGFGVTLLAVAVATIPVLHEGSLTFTPFLMALSVFGIGGTFGSIAVVVAVAGAIGAGLLVRGWDLDPGTLTMLVVVGAVMLVARALQTKEQQREHAEHLRRESDEQLAVMAERERVARDVHDILGHSLTVMTVKSELAMRLVDLDPDRAKAELAELHSMSREALAEVRATVGGLRTPDLRSELASARTALDAAEIAADLPSDLSELPPGRNALFAWVVRESVTNVVRHSGADHCAVRVGPDRVEVVDDGTGIAEHSFGNGLRGLTERVEAAGCRLSVTATGSGTAVRVTVA